MREEERPPPSSTTTTTTTTTRVYHLFHPFVYLPFIIRIRWWYRESRHGSKRGGREWGESDVIGGGYD